MAITTTNGKLAIIMLDQQFQPNLPISPGALGQDDKQQLIWGFPQNLWGATASGGGSVSTTGMQMLRRMRYRR